jgi:hypothetical protein
MSGARALGLLLVSALAAGCVVQRAHQVDLNAASAAALAEIPGIGREDAERIVANRPYAAKGDLLARHVLTPTQYSALDPYVFVGPPGTPDYLRDVPPLPEGP